VAGRLAAVEVGIACDCLTPSPENSPPDVACASPDEMDGELVGQPWA
jgi:hypothetical protein